MPSKPICLVISHFIFLDRPERYALGSRGKSEVIVTGWCVPVWSKGLPHKKRDSTSTDEPAEEIICRYRLANEKSEAIIEVEDTGFAINLATKNICQKLLDLKDMGCASANFAHRAKWRIGGSRYPVVHFVNIADSEILTLSLGTSS